MPNASIREFTDNSVDPPVRGFLHTPEASNHDGLVLTHGAGGNAQAPWPRALADAFAEAGFTVLRCDLPYRQTRPFGPPGPGDAARDRAGLKNAIAALRRSMGAPSVSHGSLADQGGDFDSHAPKVQKSEAPGNIYLGGHSYGGRQSSMLCSELSHDAPDLVSGLLLLSYPLHPPRRPEQQRTQHLPDLRTPTLFVQGTRDPFGSIEELERAMKMIPAKTKLLPVEGAGHDLGFKGKGKKEGLPGLVLFEFAQFFSHP